MISWRILKFLLVLLGSLTTLPSANAVEPFYWRDSYGRGGGGVMSAHCDGDYDAGLCYPKCDDDYRGAGPLCWKKQGIGVRSRGVGTVPRYNCGSKEQDAGLCYEQCRSGYKGAGPVCWGMGPPGYVECGAGYAINGETCGLTTAGQITAVAALLAAVIPVASEAINRAKQAEMGPEAVGEASRLSKLMEKVMAELRPVLDDMAANAGNIAKGLEKIKAKFLARLSDDPKEAEQIFQAAKYLQKYARGASGATIQALHGPEGVIDYIRLITTITGIMDPTPVSGMVSSFAYPVYVPPPVPAAQPVVVASRDYLYAVIGSDLYYYPLQVGGSWGAATKIGTGWGAMRIVTAGGRGELFALDNQDNLYFYRHDPQLQWQVIGEKVGSGFGDMKTIVAGGNFLNNGERRALFALSKEGTLWYYDFGQGANGTLQANGVQIGWGWSDCSQLFAGTGGVVYCITSGGDLVRYAYDLRSPRDRTPVGQRVGVGWAGFTRVFAGAAGQIFAVLPSGELLAYRDLGGAVIGPQKIGTNWNLPQATAMKNW